MTRRLSAIVVLAALLLAGRAVDITRNLAGRIGPSNLGVAADIRDGRFVVVAIAAVDLSGAPAPLASAGVRVGDAIDELVDARGQRFAAESLGRVGDALAAVRVGEPWALVVSRLADDGTRRPVRIAVDGYVPPWRARLTYLAFTGLVPVLAIFTALLIALLRPDDEAAFVGSLLFLGFAAAFSGDVLVQPRGLREVVGLVSGALTTGAVYFFMRFFLLFPSAAGLDRRLPWLKQAFAAPTLLLVVAIEVYTLLSLVSFDWAAAFDDVLRRQWIEVTYGVTFLLMFGIGLASLLGHTLGAETPGARRRLGILLAGALAGLGPFVVAATYAQVTGTPQLSLEASLLVVLALPLFPLAFIYAVVRHRVLGVGVIVRRGVRYALVSRGVLVVEAALVFAVFFFAVGPTLSRWLPGADTGTTAALSALAAVVAGRALVGINRRLRPVLDRHFFRSHYSPEEVLTQVSGTVKLLAAEPVQMVEAVAHVLGAALHPRHLAVYLDVRRTGHPAAALPNGHGETATTSAFTLVSWLAIDERTGELWPVTERPPQVVSHERLGRVLAERVRRKDDVVEVDFDRGDTPFGPLVRGKGSDGRAHDAVEDTASTYQVLRWLGTAAIVPLATTDGLLGWISLGEKLSEEAYSPEDRAVLRAIGSQLGIALEYAQLIGLAAEQQAFRRELEIARQVQAELFPQIRPPVRGVDYTGSCRTAREVGGDYYDFLDLGERFGLAVGDITGKGVSAALLMASLQAMLRSRAPLQQTRLDRLVTDLNHQLVVSTAPSKFATLFYAVYEETTRALTYVNAGHNPALLFRAGATAPELLPPTGMALGLSLKATYTEAARTLDAGDLLVMYTDGVTEAMNAAGADYGEERLVAVVARCRHLHAVDIHDAILDDLDRFVGDAPRHDDITLVVARMMPV